ncbi:MAG: hypothetical protein ACRDHY_19815, partial [Anaerolineales bacterium]
MASAKQVRAAKRSIRKAQSRRRPGSPGRGRYYRIEVRPRVDFVSFRTQDVGQPGHIQRVAGRRASGSWATASWLISKSDAHTKNGRLVADTRAAEGVLQALGSAPVHVNGDRFGARPR